MYGRKNMQNPCYKNVKLSVIESRTDRQTEGRKYVLMYDPSTIWNMPMAGASFVITKLCSVPQSIIIHTNNYI